jgi:hypothetical protein
VFSFLKRPLREHSFWQRLVSGALLGAAALGIPAVVLLLITILGGRYQIDKSGVEEDMLVKTLVYPVGGALAGALGFAFGSIVRATWQAAVWS